MSELLANEEERKAKAFNVKKARSRIAGKRLAKASEMGGIDWSELSSHWGNRT